MTTHTDYTDYTDPLLIYHQFILTKYLSGTRNYIKHKIHEVVSNWDCATESHKSFFWGGPTPKSTKSEFHLLGSRMKIWKRCLILNSGHPWLSITARHFYFKKKYQTLNIF